MAIKLKCSPTVKIDNLDGSASETGLHNSSMAISKLQYGFNHHMVHIYHYAMYALKEGLMDSK